MIYSLLYDKMTNSERALALSAQGLINRSDKKVFIDVDNYKQYLSADAKLTQTDVLTLVKKFCGCFSGFVTYTLSPVDAGISMAATISAAYDVLGVPRELEEAVANLGLKKLYDLSEVKGDNVDRQKIVFDFCFEKLNKNGLVHQVVSPNNFHLRLYDLAIAKRFACVYTDESEKGREFRRYVLSRLNKNIPIYGWTTDEITFVKDISVFGNYVLPSDWSCNHSFFSQREVTISQSRKEKEIRKNKHYIALVVSDGDNIQWLERDFSMPNGSFGQRLSSSLEYKMNWTLSPSLVTLCPSIAGYIYKHVGYDYFISGVSGIGYANLLEYPTEYLPQFTEKTQIAMQKSDLSVVCMLDNINNTKDCNHTRQVLQNYSKFDTIKGGVWELDPDRYGSGKGKIFWSQGKPFVSVRFTMWHPSCQMDKVTAEWLDDLARQVNAMPVSVQAEEGYSVVNVHPWTMNQHSVDYFVSKLDKDKIELVYVDELLELIKTNIGDKN